MDFTKRAETAGILLAKLNAKKLVARVGLQMDISGSMRQLYSQGIVQETVTSIAAMATQFDDDGQLDMWAYADKCVRLSPANAQNYGNYVNGILLNEALSIAWGTTEYTPPFKDAIKRFFIGEAGGWLTSAKPPKDAGTPAMVFFITDGAPSDQVDAAQVLKDSAKHDIYWVMIGIGAKQTFRFLEKQADALDNVGFLSMVDLHLSPDDLYQTLLTDELVRWINKPR